MRTNRRQASKKKAGSGKARRRKLGTLALAKSARKPLPRPTRPFKDKRGKIVRDDWPDDSD